MLDSRILIGTKISHVLFGQLRPDLSMLSEPDDVILKLPNLLAPLQPIFATRIIGCRPVHCVNSRARDESTFFSSDATMRNDAR